MGTRPVTSNEDSPGLPTTIPHPPRDFRGLVLRAAGFGHGLRPGFWFWGGGRETWTLPAAVAVALDDDLVGVVSEAVEGTLGEDGIVEQGDPFLDGSVGCLFR